MRTRQLAIVLLLAGSGAALARQAGGAPNGKHDKKKPGPPTRTEHGLGDATAQAAQAKELFKNAEVHFSLGEFDRALELYREAYKTRPLPAFLFNIGQCHRNKGQCDKAIFFFKQYLVRSPEAANKADVEKLLRICEQEEKKEEKKAPAAAADRPPPATPPTKRRQKRRQTRRRSGQDGAGCGRCGSGPRRGWPARCW